MLIRLFRASKINGAPSQPALYKLTKKPVPPSFLRYTPEGWRVETDDPEWATYIAKASVNSLSQKIKQNVNDEYTPESQAAAATEKLIQQARNERIKAESAAIDLEVKKCKYVEVEKMRYLLSYFQRGITEGYEHIKRTYKDDTKLALICNELKRYIDTMAMSIEKEISTWKYYE
jgi:hypothetical protein